MSRKLLVRTSIIPVASVILIGMLAAPDCAYPAGFKVLHAFQGGSDGAQPGVSRRDRSGALYGVTGDGGGTGCGGTGCGTVFKLTGTTETILYRFRGGKTGYFPDGNVIMDKRGNLYGTTYYGGNKGCNGNGCGTVYRLAADGTETVLHVFVNGRDGALPLASLVRVGSDLYGTTTEGGVKNCGPYNCGTVFKIDKNGTETVAHRFKGGADGTYPASNLIADSAGNLYGTTVLGGSNGCSNSGCGTVFKIAPDGTETVLHAFVGGTDGSGPTSSLARDASGNLYGTTAVGGGSSCMGYGCGTVFKVSAQGKEQVLYAFQGTSDGNWPWGNLIIDATGNLYGIAELGGTGSGVVFQLDTRGSENVLYAFTGGSDGAQPSGLIADRKGKLFGATLYGGSGGQGVVFDLPE
ncbi:MAG TPA: choice-of-anchor tandem repeat GloVer-containing protein [Rhizomicrobium sp.]|jgi:uncharacterized repeat protein (TIGR03803 family)|nr:choice-of-anchor tandem repeat GloVer-containing protein [Rhizomicrobium sp.]